MYIWLKENWFKLVLLLLVMGLFYWYELRPHKIRKDCWDWAFEETQKRNGDRDDVNYFYKKCFREKGLQDDF